MGTIASLLFWVSAHQAAQVDLHPPTPAPAPRESWEPFCIQEDEPPVILLPTCPDRFPDLPALSFLDPCPDRIDEMIAEAERFAP